MTDYNKLQNFLQYGKYGKGFQFDGISYSLLEKMLQPSRIISREIKELLFTEGGKSFTSNAKLIITPDQSFDLIHFMGNPLILSDDDLAGVQRKNDEDFESAVQETLLSYVRKKPYTSDLPIINLDSYKKIWAGIDPENKSNFGRIFLQFDSGNKYFDDLDDLFNHFELN